MTGFQEVCGLPDFLGLFLPVRHASEQYLTSSQFFAQLFRHTISRPQAMQVFLGKRALLPLKPAATNLCSVQRVVIVVSVSAVVTAAQLHRHILVGVGNALNTEQWGTVRHLQQ